LKEENSLKLREDVARKALVLRGLPEIIALHTTEMCNLRCLMCRRSEGQGGLKMSRDRLEAVCDALFPTAWKASLSGAAGEPLISDFDLVLEKALEHETRIDTVTNGTRLDLNLYRKGRPVFDHVSVSIDSCVPQVYEKIRVGASFEKLDADLRSIAEERRTNPDGVLFSLSSVVMHSTLPHMEDLIRYTRDLGMDGLILQRLFPEVPYAHEQDPMGDIESLKTMLEGFRKTAEELKVNLFLNEFGLENLIVSPLRAKVPPQLEVEGICWYPFQHIGVQPTGEVFPCPLPTTYLLGDVNHQSPEEIWNSRAAQELRAVHYAGKGSLFCSGCMHAPHLAPRRPVWLIGWLRRRAMRRAEARHLKARGRRRGSQVKP
jgi:radical SAM protein with 4Fe4S-binding SPASM domain